MISLQIYLPTGAYVKVSRGKKRLSQFINVQMKSSSSDYGLTEGIVFNVKSMGAKEGGNVYGCGQK